MRPLSGLLTARRALYASHYGQYRAAGDAYSAAADAPMAGRSGFIKGLTLLLIGLLRALVTSSHARGHYPAAAAARRGALDKSAAQRWSNWAVISRRSP